MPGSLSDILPQPLDEQSEEILNDLLKRKVTSAAGLAVDLLHAMEERFGPEAREVVRDMTQRRRFRRALPIPAKQRSPCVASATTLIRRVSVRTAGNERLTSRSASGISTLAAYRAEVFRELGEPELGYIFCAGDEPAVRACHPQLGFRRTQTLMLGDPLCDHVFLVEDESTGSLPAAQPI